MCRARAQNLKRYFFLLHVTHIHPEQKATAYKLFLDTFRVVFMHHSAEGYADESSGARCH